MKKIAVIILAHKLPKMLHRLLCCFPSQGFSIFLHIDKSLAKPQFELIFHELAGINNLIWLPRYYSHWGSWGLVQASLAGLRLAQQANCDYAILLSGQDYPIKPMGHLLSFLEANPGFSYLQFHALPSPAWPPDGAGRYTRWHFNLLMPDSPLRKLANRALKRAFNTLMPNRSLPQGLKPYGGWQWWCLERAAIAYMLDFTATNPKVVRFFETVRIPDEMYFHTVLLNSPLAASIQNRILTYADWNGPPYPRVLGQADFPALARSDCFFARKFDPAVDATVLDRVDIELLPDSH